MLSAMARFRFGFRPFANCLVWGLLSLAAPSVAEPVTHLFLAEGALPARNAPVLSFDAHGLRDLAADGSDRLSRHGAVLLEVATQMQSGNAAQAALTGATPQLRAGYDIGRTYGFLSFSPPDLLTTDPRADERPAFGLGLRISVNRALQLTGEIQHLEDDGSGRISDDRVSLQAAFRF